MHSKEAAFIECIRLKALASDAVNHPYLTAFCHGEFPDMTAAIQDFAFQYGLYSRQFVRYLSAVIKQLQQQKHRETLIENLTEEQGDTHGIELPEAVLMTVTGVPHTQLFQRFQTAVGIDNQYRTTMPQSPTAQLWSEQFLQLCEMDECVGIGAIGIGTELIVSSIYHQILEGLKNHSDLTMTERVFFDLHSQCDDEHAVEMLLIAQDLAQDDMACEKIEYGVNMAIKMRTLFWDKMLERALGFPASATIETQRLSIV